MASFFSASYSTAALKLQVKSPLKPLVLEGYSFAIGTTLTSTASVTLLAGPTSNSYTTFNVGNVQLGPQRCIVDVNGVGGNYLALAFPASSPGNELAFMWGSIA